MNNRLKRVQSGFTLIELVVVIVILGILAATALPKFVDMQGEANQAVAKGVAGAVSSASALGMAKALAGNATSYSKTCTEALALVDESTGCSPSAGTAGTCTDGINGTACTITCNSKSATARVSCYP